MVFTRDCVNENLHVNAKPIDIDMHALNNTAIEEEEYIGTISK